MKHERRPSSIVGNDWLAMEASCVCFFGGLVVVRVADGGQKRRRFCGASCRFPCSCLCVCVFANTRTSQTSLNISLQHMFQQKPQTPKAISCHFLKSISKKQTRKCSFPVVLSVIRWRFKIKASAERWHTHKVLSAYCSLTYIIIKGTLGAIWQKALCKL